MKIAIVLHLYYTDLWEEFRDKLVKLNVDFDLYVSLCVENEDITDKIKINFPEAKIFYLPNKGVDIGPFIVMMQYFIANNKKYDYIIKLHSKKSFHIGERGNKWRSVLVNTLIGESDKLDATLKYMNENKVCKIAIPTPYALREDNYQWMQHILDNLNIDITKIDRIFSGGTMFIIDYNLLIDFFKHINLNILYDQMYSGYDKNDRLEHALERIFCFIAQIDENEILLID